MASLPSNDEHEKYDHSDHPVHKSLPDDLKTPGAARSEEARKDSSEPAERASRRP
jgi:hypothetical protein